MNYVCITKNLQENMPFQCCLESIVNKWCLITELVALKCILGFFFITASPRVIRSVLTLHWRCCITRPILCNANENLVIAVPNYLLFSRVDCTKIFCTQYIFPKSSLYARTCSTYYTKIPLRFYCSIKSIIISRLWDLICKWMSIIWTKSLLENVWFANE